MNAISKNAVGLSVVAALLMPAGALAAPPAHSNASPQGLAKSAQPKTKKAKKAKQAKAYGKNCKGQSKVKDPLTRTSPFKLCVKAKGVVPPPPVGTV